MWLSAECTNSAWRWAVCLPCCPPHAVYVALCLARLSVPVGSYPLDSFVCHHPSYANPHCLFLQPLKWSPLQGPLNEWVCTQLWFSVQQAVINWVCGQARDTAACKVEDVEQLCTCWQKRWKDWISERRSAFVKWAPRALGLWNGRFSGHHCGHLSSSQAPS